MNIFCRTDNYIGHTHARTHARTHAHTNARTHTHTHTRTHTRTHTHTHTFAGWLPPMQNPGYATVPSLGTYVYVFTLKILTNAEN